MKIVTGGSDKYNLNGFSGTDVFCSIEFNIEDEKKSIKTLTSEIMSRVPIQQELRFISATLDAYSRGVLEFNYALLKVKEYKVKQAKLLAAFDSDKFKKLVDNDIEKLKKLVEENTNG